MLRIPLNLLLVTHIILYYFAKSIIWASVIGNNSPELSYDAVIFKDRKKDIKLIFPAMACYLAKGKEGLLPLKGVCSVMCTDP